jgi:hypothetical protein
MIRFQPDLLEPLDAWRASQGEPASRPEAIRALLTEALRIKGAI